MPDTDTEAADPALIHIRHRNLEFCPLARELGMAGKILLGSDFPNLPYPYARQLAGLARIGLGDDWLRRVCWDNPVALFGLPETVS